MVMLSAGTAARVITPPVGTHLEGYGGREGGAVGVHDDLYARALVLDDGESRVAIVACDLIGIDRHTTAAVRTLVAASTDIPPENVMVCATHTHAGPVGMHRRDDAALRDVQNRLIAGAVEQAWRSRHPCVMAAGVGSVDTVSQNRRDPAGPIDSALHVLLFDALDHHGPPVASLVNFACHATVLYYTNMHVSADYPGHVVNAVQQLTGAPTMFLQGACGDVNPVWMEQDFAETARVGNIIGAEAGRRILELRPASHGQHVWNIRWDEMLDVPATGDRIPPRIRVGSRHVSVNLRVLPPVEEYDRQLDALEVERRLVLSDDVAGKRLVMEKVTRLRGERATSASIRGPAELKVELQAIALGPDCAILALPGEFFAETALAIRSSCGIKHLFIACYANHHVMYVPPRHEFDKGGYEPGVAILNEDAEEAFRAAAIDLLREVAVN
jgi:hypothetical protein